FGCRCTDTSWRRSMMSSSGCAARCSPTTRPVCLRRDSPGSSASTANEYEPAWDQQRRISTPSSGFFYGAGAVRFRISLEPAQRRQHAVFERRFVALHENPLECVLGVHLGDSRARLGHQRAARDRLKAVTPPGGAVTAEHRAEAELTAAFRD